MATSDNGAQKAAQAAAAREERADDERGAELRELAQEIHDATIRRPRGGAPVAPAHVYAVHPDTGDEVVFVPGELLPDWAARAAAGEGRYERGDDGVLRVHLDARRGSKGGDAK
ncbi:hypothetical protein ACIBSS_17610 [Micromonospora aurantiaca]|uniref:hypothetical protein n=1 Tax=Micromonospora aurantiaca (nom. illeg.) TaxID=47850 RepID=UPI0037B0063F